MVDAERGSGRTAGDAREYMAVEGAVRFVEPDDSGRASVSIGTVPGIALPPGERPRALERSSVSKRRRGEPRWVSVGGG